MQPLSLAEKRSAIERYVEASEGKGHHYFELDDGTPYEGYIIEIHEHALLFEWAYSPISNNHDEQPFAVPIQQINTNSFR